MSRSRALIEAYASAPDRQREGREQSENADLNPEDSDAGLVRALDFLDSCVLPFSEADPAGTLERRVAAAAAAPSPLAPGPKHSAWRVPRGLVYWLNVAAAAGVTWRLTASVVQSVIAALIASAAVILLELVLRMIDPRIARRLGLAEGRSDVAMYGAATILGIGGGIAIAYFV